MKKNVVFWIGVKNEKYSEKYGGWDWMDISRKTWEYWCEITILWEDLKTGVAKDVKAKNKMIDIYNTIYGTGYNPNTNCGSCISTCYDGIKKLYNKYNTQ